MRTGKPKQVRRTGPGTPKALRGATLRSLADSLRHVMRPKGKK